jgi:hypothetical protein
MKCRFQKNIEILFLLYSQSPFITLTFPPRSPCPYVSLLCALRIFAVKNLSTFHFPLSTRFYRAKCLDICTLKPRALCYAIF